MYKGLANTYASNVKDLALQLKEEENNLKKVTEKIESWVKKALEKQENREHLKNWLDNPANQIESKDVETYKLSAYVNNRTYVVAVITHHIINGGEPLFVLSGNWPEIIQDGLNAVLKELEMTEEFKEA